MYHVGGKDRTEGRTGFAHFFEHLLFEGTENIEKGKWFEIVASNGGSNNANTTQDRTWSIILGEKGRFTATAADVPGEAQGRQVGATIRMQYPIRLPDDVGGHLLKTVDWIYLTADGTMINRSQFRKFGFKVAELVATIRQKDPE